MAVPEPIYPEPGLGTRSCNTLHEHDGHIWYHWGIGYWNCNGNDGTISLGDKYWWWSMGNNPIRRYRVAAELIKWSGGTFFCAVVDTGGHPEFQAGDSVYASIGGLLDGSTGWHKI